MPGNASSRSSSPAISCSGCDGIRRSATLPPASRSRATCARIYYDTPDHRLRALGISLRLRSDGQSWLQTVEVGTDVRGGASNPLEAEIAVDGRARSRPDRQPQGAAQGREGDCQVGPRAGVRDRGQAHHPPPAGRRWRARAGARRGHRARRQRRGRAVRGGAGAEIGRAGVPAADRRKSVRGRARASLREQQGRARLQPGTRPDQRACPHRAAARRAARARPEPYLRRSFCADRAVGGRPDCGQPARRAGDGGPCRRPPAAHRPAAAAQRAQRFPPAARHGRAARAGGARPGARPHGGRVARRRRADRADLCAGGGDDGERSRLAAPARGAARASRSRPRAGAGGAQWAAMVGAAALSGAVAADHRAHRQARWAGRASSPARR